MRKEVNMKAPAYLKSKTMMANTFFLAVVACLTAYDVPMKPELVVVLQTALNIGLRYMTKGPMSAK